MMERPSYVAALSVPFLRQAMIEVPESKDAGHIADVQIERYVSPGLTDETHLDAPIRVREGGLSILSTEETTPDSVCGAGIRTAIDESNSMPAHRQPLRPVNQLFPTECP